MTALTPAQRLEVSNLLRAIADGSEPSIAAISIDWAYLNKRAVADKSTLSIVGMESFQDHGVRAKGNRRK